MAQDNKLIRSLIQSAKLGNNAAFKQLLEMNLESVYSLAFSLSGSVSTAELITINSLVNAFLNIDSIGEDETFSEWIKNITINHALDEIISKKQSKESLRESDKDQPDVEQPSSPIVKAYKYLSEEDRLIFALNLICGYPVTEIADLMQLKQSEIEQRIANSISVLINAAGNDLSTDMKTKDIESMFSVIKPDPGLLTRVVNKINEIKEQEYDAKSKEAEERIERENLEIKRKKKAKRKSKDETPKKKKKIFLKSKTGANKKIIISVFIIALAVVVIYYLNSFSPTWIVSIKAGSPEINNKIITSNTKLETDAILSTNSSSEAVVTISKVGTIQLFPLTTLKRIGNSYSAKLINGRIKINTDNAEDFLELQLPGGTITDFYLGTIYIVDLDANGNSIIELISGWLYVEDKEKSTIFPEGYSLKIFSSKGAGLPYKSNSDPKLVELLDKIVFEKFYKSGIDQLISIATDNEKITLWNLLQRVDKEQREYVYAKLYELVPHPDAIEKEKILNLDRESLQVWLEEIEWQM